MIKVSKALLRSIKMTPVNFPSSIFYSHLSINPFNTVSQECFGLNPKISYANINMFSVGWIDKNESETYFRL